MRTPAEQEVETREEEHLLALVTKSALETQGALATATGEAGGVVVGGDGRDGGAGRLAQYDVASVSYGDQNTIQVLSADGSQKFCWSRFVLF